MKLVTSYGGVYRLTDRNYLRLIQAIASSGNGVNVLDYGGKFVGVIVANISDMTPDEAELLLEGE